MILLSTGILVDIFFFSRLGIYHAFLALFYLKYSPVSAFCICVGLFLWWLLISCFCFAFAEENDLSLICISGRFWTVILED